MAPCCYLRRDLRSGDFAANPFAFGTRGVRVAQSVHYNLGHNLGLVLACPIGKVVEDEDLVRNKGATSAYTGCDPRVS